MGGPYIFRPPNNPQFEALHDVYPLWKLFEAVVLQQNYRQGEGNRWTELLNRARTGDLTQEDIDILKQKVVKESSLDPNVLNLFYKNIDVNDHNKKMLNTLDTNLVEVKATVLPKKYQPKIKKGRVDDTQFMEVLQMKIGARVKLVTNISTLDKLVNGSLGTIAGFEWRNDKEGNAHVVTVMISLDDLPAGEIQRLKYPKESKKFEHENATPIFICEQDYQIRSKYGKGQVPKAKVIQFPLRLAWASTAHGVQVINYSVASTKVINCILNCLS